MEAVGIQSAECTSGVLTIYREYRQVQILHTLLVKHYIELLDRQSSEWGRDEVTYFYVRDVFGIYLGPMYADFQEKIFAEISGRNFQTFHCSNVTTRLHPSVSIRIFKYK